jgi:hypothetical protein
MVTRRQLSQWIHALHTEGGRIRYYNFWDGETAEEIWFTGFLRSRHILDSHPKARFALFSTLGSINLLNIDEHLHHCNRNRKRLFFTGENIHHPVFNDYKDNLLDRSSIDLSLGFDYIDNPRYLRFPIWLLEMFPPQSSVEDIKNICNRLSHQQLEPERNRFCALVAGTSTLLGTESLQMRTTMVEQLNAIDRVDCAGRLLHNTDELFTKFGDNKAEFLRQYRFFICPENTSVEGYVTEKVFHCIGSGCVPIYWGSNNNPEPDVLNHDAILFWQKDGDNSALLHKIEELNNNPAIYREFFEQPRLKDDAWQVVATYFEKLEQHLNDLFR